MDKSTKATRLTQAKTGLNLVVSFFVLFIVNFLVLFIANAIFPANVVLGTYSLTPAWALILVAEKLALIGVLAMPFVTYQEWKREKDFSPRDWMLTYFVVNTVAIWLISRFAANLGFGISSWFVAILLGAALDWVQGLAMMAYGKLVQN